MTSLFTKKNRNGRNKVERRFFTIERKLTAVDNKFIQIDERFDQIDRRFAQVDERFDQIDRRFAQVDERFDKIEAKIDNLTTMINTVIVDVKDMKKRLTAIEERVTTIEGDIVGIHKYMKLESTFKEKRDEVFISKLYLHNNPTSIVTPVNIGDIYNRTGQRITDADGFLFITTIPLIVPKPSNELVARISPYVSTKNFLKNEHIVYDATMLRKEYIIIESKHSLSKAKIDSKLRQIGWIRIALQDAKGDDWTKAHSNYRMFIDRLIHGTGLPRSDLYHDINLIFSSDDITNELFEYITAIDGGISEEQYNTLTLNIFFSDPYIRDIIELITKNNKIPKRKRDVLTQKPHNIDRVRDLFKDPDIISIDEVNKQMSHIHPTLISFSKMEPHFLSMRGKLGVSQFNTVTMPQLFQKTSLNSI
jgi:hypothetical protein